MSGLNEGHQSDFLANEAYTRLSELGLQPTTDECPWFPDLIAIGSDAYTHRERFWPGCASNDMRISPILSVFVSPLIVKSKSGLTPILCNLDPRPYWTAPMIAVNVGYNLSDANTWWRTWRPATFLETLCAQASGQLHGSVISQDKEFLAAIGTDQQQVSFCYFTPTFEDEGNKPADILGFDQTPRHQRSGPTTGLQRALPKLLYVRKVNQYVPTVRYSRVECESCALCGQRTCSDD